MKRHRNFSLSTATLLQSGIGQKRRRFRGNDTLILCPNFRNEEICEPWVKPPTLVLFVGSNVVNNLMTGDNEVVQLSHGSRKTRRSTPNDWEAVINSELS